MVSKPKRRESEREKESFFKQRVASAKGNRPPKMSYRSNNEV